LIAAVKEAVNQPVLPHEFVKWKMCLPEAVGGKLLEVYNSVLAKTT
jgi:hypothetical protein